MVDFLNELDAGIAIVAIKVVKKDVSNLIKLVSDSSGGVHTSINNLFQGNIKILDTVVFDCPQTQFLCSKDLSIHSDNIIAGLCIGFFG